jgi:[ribosomal protein S5]-alanine N-acetyltransferase
LSAVQPLIATPRLKIFALTSADSALVLTIFNMPSFHQNVGDRGLRTAEDGHNYTANLIKMHTERGHGMWKVCLADSGEPIGLCGLIKRDALEDVDVGFAFFPSTWGNGYASEAAKACVEYGRIKLGLKRMAGIVAPHNLASVRILQKLGMKYVRDLEMKPGNVVQVFEMDL